MEKDLLECSADCAALEEYLCLFARRDSFVSSLKGPPIRATWWFISRKSVW